LRVTKITTTAVLAASLVSAGGIAAGTATAAPARLLPKIQTGTSGVPPGGWHHGWKVRPGFVYFGGGASFSSPRVKSLRWSQYGQHSARAGGKWWIDNCKPTCASGGHWVAAQVHFYHVFNHSGPGRNFGEVRVTWHGHAWHSYINRYGRWAYVPLK
jgi:hypothetical protein